MTNVIDFREWLKRRARMSCIAFLEDERFPLSVRYPPHGIDALLSLMRLPYGPLGESIAINLRAEMVPDEPLVERADSIPPGLDRSKWGGQSDG